jgi:hypothetical protein
MAEVKYNIKESWNRIVRAFWGAVVPSDSPGNVPGESYSIDEALSLLAELAENKLTGQTGQVPAGWTVPVAGVQDATTSQKGVAELATNAEAIAGTDTERIVTPAGLAAAIAEEAHEYGDIYTASATGTVTLSIGNSWTKLTGTFTSAGLSTSNINADEANDRLIINSVGTYLVQFQLGFSGTINSDWNFAIYLDSVRQDNVRTVRKLSSLGDRGSCSAVGHITVTGTNMAVEVYAQAEQSGRNFLLQAGQIVLDKAPT